MLLLEAYGLQQRTLPWRYAFTLTLPFRLPFLLEMGSKLDVHIPDFFALLDAEGFWGPTVLWVLTSLLLPMLAGWFFNLSGAAAGRASSSSSSLSSAALRKVGEQQQQHRVDPLAFNVAKALLAWLVYERGAGLGGLVSRESVDVVRASLPGGVAGVLVGTGIGGLGCLWEAVLAGR